MIWILDFSFGGGKISVFAMNELFQVENVGAGVCTCSTCTHTGVGVGYSCTPISMFASPFSIACQQIQLG